MASSLPPRSSSASYLKKENAGPTRREMGFKERPSRNVPSSISNVETNGGTPSASVGGGGGVPPVMEFSGRDDDDHRGDRMARVQGSPPWSDLPLELLSLVFLRLPTRADRAFFPAVCRMWCSAARQSRLPPLSPAPWIVQPSNGTVTSLPPGETFCFPAGVRYHTSCGIWLVLTRDDGSCFLMNPFTRATMPLPSLSSYSYYEHPVELGDGMDPDIDSEETWRLRVEDRDEISIVSLVVCSTRLIAAIVARTASGYPAAIALCRPGAAAWSVSAHDECRQLSHMVFFQGKLYALHGPNIGSFEDLICIDIVDEHGSDVPRVSRIECFIQGACHPDIDDEDYTSYLLESHGSLLTVRRKVSFEIDHCGHRVGSSEFEVLKVDLEQHMWADVRTLGNDQALFLGQGCSTAVCVSPYDLSRDCIFFLDDCNYYGWYYWDKETIISCGVYDMKDEKTYLPLPMASWKDEKGPPANWIFWQRSSVDTAVLFDGIEEGGIRAPAYSSREIHEQENDQAMDSLHDRVRVLKRIQVPSEDYLGAIG